MHLIQVNVIICLVPMVLILLLVKKIAVNKLETNRSFKVVKWMILSYTVLVIINFILGVQHASDHLDFLGKAVSSYANSFGAMFLSVVIFPFMLLVKKLASKGWFLLMLAFLMNVGWYFEKVVIVITSLHRDYSSSDQGFEETVHKGLLVITLQGIMLAVLTLVATELIGRKQEVVRAH